MATCVHVSVLYNSVLWIHTCTWGDLHKPKTIGLLKESKVSFKWVQRLTKMKSTIMFLSFQTDRSGQKVKTQIRGAVWSGSNVCHSVHIFWMHYSIIKPLCSNFRVITANLSGVRNFKVFTVWYQLESLSMKQEVQMTRCFDFEIWFEIISLVLIISLKCMCYL